MNRLTGNSGFDVVPSDSNNITGVELYQGSGAALFVGVGGDVKVDLVGSGTVTFKNIASGTFMPIQVKKVYQNGTTATNMIALY